jgi:glycosyltransferase involved in cell wall biosynthesis
MKITIGLPTFNEEKNIGNIINELKKKYESIIVCDDGSTDSTYEILEKMDVEIVRHEKNLGYGAAINSIFKKSQELLSDVLVTFDADGQHKIEDIEKVITPVKDGKSDISIGSRFLDSKNNVPGYRKVGIKIITHVTNSSIKNKITDSQSGFRAYNKNVLNQIKPLDLGMGISTEILIKASSLGLSITEVPIEILYDGKTSTHNPVSQGASVLITTIKYTSIEHPLKFYGIPAVFFLIVGAIFTYFSVQFYTEVGRLNTNLTLIAGSTVLIGVVLFLTAVLLFSLVSVVRENRSKI